MDSLKPPQSLSFDGNIAENWKAWKQRFEVYSIASGASEKSEAVKIAILLHVLGDEAIEKYNTFNLSEENKKSYNSILAAFENYCVPKSNESVDRHFFFHECKKRVSLLIIF